MHRGATAGFALWRPFENRAARAGVPAVKKATTIGTQILLYANTAQFYPLAMRSTGLGWASGVGRTGAIVGPLLGGSLLAAALPLQMNFLVFAIPGLVAALAMGCFILFNRRSATPLVAPVANPASRRAPTAVSG